MKILAINNDNASVNGAITSVNEIKSKVNIYSDDTNTANGIDIIIDSSGRPIVYSINGVLYSIPNPTTLVQTLNAPPVSNSRFDVIFVNSSGVISHTTGVTAENPIKPILSSDSLELASVLVSSAGVQTFQNTFESIIVTSEDELANAILLLNNRLAGDIYFGANITLTRTHSWNVDNIKIKMQGNSLIFNGHLVEIKGIRCNFENSVFVGNRAATLFKLSDTSNNTSLFTFNECSWRNVIGVNWATVPVIDAETFVGQLHFRFYRNFVQDTANNISAYSFGIKQRGHTSNSYAVSITALEERGDPLLANGSQQNRFCVIGGLKGTGIVEQTRLNRFYTDGAARLSATPVTYPAIINLLADHTHPATAISVNASGFNGNLSPADTNLQLIAQKIDDLVITNTPTTSPTASEISVATQNFNGVFSSSLAFATVQRIFDWLDDWLNELQLPASAISVDPTNFGNIFENGVQFNTVQKVLDKIDDLTIPAPVTTLPANAISVDTTNFDGLFQPEYDTVQKCLDVIDGISATNRSFIGSSYDYTDGSHNGVNYDQILERGYYEFQIGTNIMTLNFYVIDASQKLIAGDLVHIRVIGEESSYINAPYFLYNVPNYILLPGFYTFLYMLDAFHLVSKTS